jgi:hypothetical protein
MAGDRELELMDDSANSFGVESRGVAEIRGNGCLALTADEVLFVMWPPRRELRISRERISVIERAGSHLGKSWPKRSGRCSTAVTSRSCWVETAASCWGMPSR